MGISFVFFVSRAQSLASDNVYHDSDRDGGGWGVFTLSEFTGCDWICVLAASASDHKDDDCSALAKDCLRDCWSSLFWAVTLIGAIKISRNLRENIQLRLQSIDREKILKVSEQRYRHIFINAPLGIFHYDADSVIVDCNEEFIRILGSSRELLIGLKMVDVLQEQKMLHAIRDSLTSR